MYCLMEACQRDRNLVYPNSRVLMDDVRAIKEDHERP